MKRMSGILTYDGTGFSGYQIQPNQRTVQGVLEQTLTKIHKGECVKTTASGRTDSGVHALGQVFHFDTPLAIEPSAWEMAVNTLLPKDLQVKSFHQVQDDFHSRFDVVTKEYRYHILNQKNIDVFKRNFAFHYPYDIDVDKMRQGATHLIGHHDFTSFCSIKTNVLGRTRRINELEIHEDEGDIIIRVEGNGFLYNMVRIIVGTLLEVGSGLRTVDEVPAILAAKDRGRAGRTAPAHGLYLWKVTY